MKTLTTQSGSIFFVLALLALLIASNAHAHCTVYHPHHCTTGKIGSLPTDSIASFQDHLIANKKGRCLDISGGRNANRTNVQLFDCNGTKSQRWSYAGKEIRNVMGRCLEVAGGVFANRTNIQIFDCNGSKSQKWRFNLAGEIRNDKEGRCLEITGGVNANRTNIQLFDCNATTSQKWQKINRSYRSPGRID
jgi:hypothetical protein